LRQKVISIGGGYCDVDITEVQKIIDHPLFQRLRFLKQLGPLLTVFPGATHTRFMHCLRVFNDARRLYGDNTLAIYGLLHDVFHGPLSHILEPLYPEDHDEYAERRIGDLKDVIAAAVDFDAVLNLFARKDKRYLIIHDRNVGLEKLDYLTWDARFCDYGGTPEVNALYGHIHFLPETGEMAVDVARIEELKALQEAYVRNYKNIYLRKQSLILNRFFQKLGKMCLENGIDAANLRSWTDDEFFGYLFFTKDKNISELYGCFRERLLPKVAINLRPLKFAKLERVNGKTLCVKIVDKKTLNKFCSWSIQKIAEAEEKIAEMVKISPNRVFVVTQTRPDRFVPKDILIIDGKDRRLLSEIFPDHFQNLREIADSCLLANVCVLPAAADDRAKLASFADEATDYLVKNA